MRIDGCRMIRRFVHPAWACLEIGPSWCGIVSRMIDLTLLCAVEVNIGGFLRRINLVGKGMGKSNEEGFKWIWLLTLMSRCQGFP